MTFEQYAENLLEDFNTRILDEMEIFIYILLNIMILQKYSFPTVLMMMTKIFSSILKMQEI